MDEKVKRYRNIYLIHPEYQTKLISSMSYEIIYDKQFVKLEREDKPTVFIPMIYGGSNNCFDITYDRLGRRRERRERSWFSFDWVCDGAKYDTMEAMLQR